jgi:hypothetical protein
MDSADNTLKSKLHDVIFGYETLAGKLFDVDSADLSHIPICCLTLPDSDTHIAGAAYFQSPENVPLRRQGQHPLQRAGEFRQKDRRFSVLGAESHGDIAPHTPLGQAVAALAMIVGYGIIAVPTGIVGAELFTEQRRQDAPAPIARTCQGCELATHEADAAFCKRCGCSL